jgi:hypothetical protein
LRDEGLGFTEDEAEPCEVERSENEFKEQVA